MYSVAVCSTNIYQPLPPVGPLPGGSADNFSLSGIQLDVAGTCSLLIKLRVAAPLPQNSRRVTRPITAGLLSGAGASRARVSNREWRAAFSPRRVLPSRPRSLFHLSLRSSHRPRPRQTRFIGLSLITRRFNYHGELTAERAPSLSIERPFRGISLSPLDRFLSHSARGFVGIVLWNLEFGKRSFHAAGILI